MSGLGLGQATGRFAPSTTGVAHPGTLLAALLCWLDARSLGARVLLRLEDLDPERSTPARVNAMEADLAWLGLSWDGVERQSHARDDHERALDVLAEQGRLYPCGCSRAALRAAGVRTPDGGFRYPGTCRTKALPAGGWRSSEEPLRVRLPEEEISPHSEDDTPLALSPAAAFGDPVVRRRDGAIAYHLAAVVDDEREGVTRIVRGRDLANTSAMQDALRALLGLRKPVHRHHLLLLEEREQKLAKLHGSVGLPELRAVYDAPGLTGVLAHAAGLQSDTAATTPTTLLEDFAWSRVGKQDRLLRWTGAALELAEAPSGEAP